MIRGMRKPPLPDEFPDVDDAMEPLDAADELGFGNGEEPEIRNRNAPDARVVRRNRTVLGSGRGSMIVRTSLVDPLIPPGDWEMPGTE